jgi:hypothetical protein
MPPVRAADAKPIPIRLPAVSRGGSVSWGTGGEHPALAGNRTDEKFLP